MTVFGKPFGEYVRFQKIFLALIAAVAIVRLVLSLAGVPNSAVKWLSVTVVVLAGTVIYGVLVYTSGFGSYKQLLPVLWLQAAVAHAIIIAGIVLSGLTGRVNIFSAPEYGGTLPWYFHALAHLAAGLIVGPLLGWLLGSIVMFVTKRVAKRPGVAAAA